MKNKKKIGDNKTNEKQQSRIFSDANWEYLCNKIKEKRNLFGMITFEDLSYIILGATFRIPRDKRQKVIAELIELNIIEAKKEGHKYCYKVLIK